MSASFKTRLAARARGLGFELCRIVRPDSIPLAPERLAAWLASGGAGDMGWMGETAARRADPRALWPDVRSVVMLAMSYAPEGDPLATLSRADAANISVYARHRDYHDVMKGKLKELAGWMVAQAGGDVKVFVDTAPVMEKPLAAAAGLGWQGRHTNLVSRDLGSWFFLGSIFTTQEIPPDAGEADHCGSCRACLDACPTQAFPAPYQLDARRCISYLTIEHKGPIPAEFRAAIGNRVYGCDDCLAACPWNKFAVAAREAKLMARADLVAPDLADLLSDDEAAFRARFAGNPVKRVGHARFLRNLLIAAGNSNKQAFTSIAEMRLAHESPLVRGMAVWALARLAPERLAALSDRAELETDHDARAEWAAAMEK